MMEARPALDGIINDWAANMDPAWLEGELTWYSSISRKTTTKPTAPVVVHFFNHQTHHRGQVHGMLTAAGAAPEATDLAFMPQ